MNIEEVADKAVELKRSGYNCAQAVAVALAEETDLSPEKLLSITAGFGAGMGTMEATCGALVGANIVAGLKTEGKGTMAHSRKLLLNFAERCGAVTCKDLKGIETGKVLCPCDECVRNAVLAYADEIN